MFALSIAGRVLSVTEDAIQYAGSIIDPSKATRIRWVRTNRYLNMVLIDQERSIIVGDDVETISVLCTAPIGTGQREAEFQAAWEAIWTSAGLSITSNALRELLEHGEVALCGCKLEPAGIWIDGSWSFLKWSGKPRLVRWEELKISSSEADLVIQSLSDPSKTMVRSFNETDNAPVLDFLVRHLLEDNRFATLGKR